MVMLSADCPTCGWRVTPNVGLGGWVTCGRRGITVWRRSVEITGRDNGAHEEASRSESESGRAASNGSQATVGGGSLALGRSVSCELLRLHSEER
eukprot:3192307-Rhodomonas_salina.1